MTEPDKYSLASEHSEESLAGAHFGEFVDKELKITTEETAAEQRLMQEDALSYEEEENLPNHIKFTIKDLEKTHEDF